MMDHFEEIRKNGGDFARYVLEHRDVADMIMTTYAYDRHELDVFDHLPAMTIDASLDDDRFKPYVVSMLKRKVDLSSDCMIEVLRSCVYMNKGNLLAVLLRNGASTSCDESSECYLTNREWKHKEYSCHGREGPLNICRLSLHSVVCFTSLCKSGYLWKYVCSQAKDGIYRYKKSKRHHVDTTEFEWLDWLHYDYSQSTRLQIISKEVMYGIMKASRTVVVKIPLLQDLANIVSDYTDYITFENSWT